MAWVETRSASFTARHDSADTDDAERVLADLERFRELVATRFSRLPGEVVVVLHSHPLQLALAQPWLPLAQLASDPAGRRYFGGWFAQGELHVLAPDVLRGRASTVPGSREALALAPLHEYVHLVVGCNNPGLPPPFTPRSFRGYLRCAWLCEGAATYFSGQHRHLRGAVARRLREGPEPALPPSSRDAALLGGQLFALLEERRDEAACVELAGAAPDADRPERLLERVFGTPVNEIARAWRDRLDELASRRPG